MIILSLLTVTLAITGGEDHDGRQELHHFIYQNISVATSHYSLYLKVIDD